MIIFLDDEIYVKPYIDVLEDHGMKVEQITTVHLCLKRIKEKIDQLELLLVDVMLPATSEDEKILKDYNLKEGMRTGSAFFEYITNKNLLKDVPVIIITNIQDQYFYDKYKKYPNIVGCFSKTVLKPFDLLKEVINILGGKKYGDY